VIPRSADTDDDALGSRFADNTTRQEQVTDIDRDPLSETARRRILVEVFLHQVDPVLKILHRPSLCPYLLEGKPYLDYARGDPVPAALASAVFYMASSTLAEDQCLALLAETKEKVLTRYKDEAKAALARVDFLLTNDVTVLQAFVLSLVSPIAMAGRVLGELTANAGGCTNTRSQPTGLDNAQRRPSYSASTLAAPDRSSISSDAV
jgi:hypothetical protein